MSRHAGKGALHRGITPMGIIVSRLSTFLLSHTYNFLALLFCTFVPEEPAQTARTLFVSLTPPREFDHVRNSSTN